MNHSLPESLKTTIGTVEWEAVSEGESGAEVWHSHIGYLKLSEKTALYPVLNDKQRLDYLAGRIPVPKVLHYAESDTHQFLLMSALEGLHPMHDDLDWSSEERIAFLAQAMRRFHTLPIDDCPFRASIMEQLARARSNIEKDEIREDLLEPEYQGRDLWELYADLEAMRPASEDWVVTHGDSYPMNIIAEPKSHELLGFIDVGALAIADRYTDFAPIANAIGWHLGQESISRFFELYGINPDWGKLKFYQLLDEFY
jgi:aminoglycoside 3'-phosphotransferase II